jgi:aminoglycoside phosphotransferase (APT) family kinase protein
VSAQVTAIEIEVPGGTTQKMVVRRHGAIDLRRNPNIAADEFKLLQIVRSAGVPAPAPLYFGRSGEIFPTPFVVLEYIEGQSEFSPPDLEGYLLQLARQLSALHNADFSEFNLSFLPKQAEIYTEKFGVRPDKLDDSLGEGRIRDVLEAAWPFPKRNAPVLLHGDYWPGNILWKDGRLVGLIDWEDSHLGDPLADLAISRLEILWAFDMDAMDNFTEQYKALSHLNFASMPYWDLCAALRPAFRISDWAGDPVRERDMREKHRLFVTRSFEALSILP